MRGTVVAAALVFGIACFEVGAVVTCVNNNRVFIMDCYNKVMYRIDLNNVLFTSVSGLEFDFSSDSVEQKTTVERC